MTDNDATQTRQDDAAKQLRAMLDERGVEWRKWNYFGIDIGTIFSASGIEWIVICDPKANNLSIANYKINHTAEQIIAATLGAGTCHVKAAKKIGDLFGFSLSCGHSMVNPFNDRPDYCPWCGAKVVDE